MQKWQKLLIEKVCKKKDNLIFWMGLFFYNLQTIGDTKTEPGSDFFKKETP